MFNAQITAHNIDDLAALLSPDHRFIDRDGQITAGKASDAECLAAFLCALPVYRNTFTRVKSQENLVVMCGYATWEAGGAPDYAIWTARVEGGLVAEWHIYADSNDNRRILGLGESND